MDQMMGDGGRFPLETWFWEMPICTRWWTTATVLMSGLVQCHLVNPFQLFYSYRAVFQNSQVSGSLFRPSSRLANLSNHLLFLYVVLAAIDDVPLLWPVLARSPIPRILSSALLATA